MAGRILVVEDDPAIARSVRRLLAHEEFYVVGASSAEEATQLLADDPEYDMVLLDINLPGKDGYDCCRQIRARGWRQPIIMLTGRANSRDKVAGLGVGADDYVTKPFEPAELLARVYAQLRRSQQYSTQEALTTRIQVSPDLVVDSETRDALVKGERVHLTAREYELLALMARFPNTPLKKSWLFQQVWGCASEMGIKLLAVTIRRLRMKIETEPETPAYVVTVRGFGYKLNFTEAAAVPG
ncbi:MAG: response regulator transcription factor [Armatimonadota bacterium]|nr:response regulator transcription factor [Armatimonadota bacterium]